MAISGAYTGQGLVNTTPVSNMAGTVASTGATAIASAAMPVLAGLTGFKPQFKDNSIGSKGWAAKNPEAAAKLTEDIEAYKATKAAAFGGDYQKYLESKRPPESPYDRELRALENSNVGDMDYEREQLMQLWQGDYGTKQMEAYYKANPDFYTPDGKRIYKDQDDINAIIKMAATQQHGVQPLTDSQKAAAEANGLDPTGQTDGDTVPAVSGGGTSSTGGTTTTPVTDTPTTDTPVSNDPAVLPDGTTFQYTPQQAAENEFMTPAGKILGEAALASGDGMQILAAQAKDLGIVDVSTLTGTLPTLEEIQATLPAGAIIEDVAAEVSQRYLDTEAAARQMVEDFQVFKGSSVKEQYAMLQDDWVGTNGENKIPFYAQGAVTAAKQAMAARGMSGSSMAAAAITQAGLEAMMPVAMKDAEFMQSMSGKAFDYQTSLSLAKLSHIANLDMSQLEHRQRIAVDTANKVFQTNISNVENSRVVAATNNANRVQALFSDQAAQNVAANLQFTTQAEQDRFYDQLGYQAQEATARLLQSNEQFNASVQNAREQFNSTMSAEIERDNVNYLRGINTANTAGINQQNMLNVQNLLNISNTQAANELILQRDELNRIFEASENLAQRTNNYAIAKLNVDAALQRLNTQQDHESSAALGGYLSALAAPLVQGGTTWLTDKLFGSSSTTSTNKVEFKV